jgi:hypothetical protein
MKGILLRHPARYRALGLLLQAALTLFFLTSRSYAAESADFNTAVINYVTRMILALFLLGALGYAAAKYLPGRFISPSRGHIKIISALNLGRDMMYIVRTGPQVVAFFTGKSGSTVLGRWSAEEWEDYEAAASYSPASPPDEKKPR